MKIKLTISVLLIFLLLSSCGKSPTDPPEDNENKSVILHATVTDSLGSPMYMAIVEIKHYYLIESIPGFSGTWTNESGRCTIQFAVINKVGKDTILVYAKDYNKGLISDTTKRHVENDGQEFYMTFILRYLKEGNI